VAASALRFTILTASRTGEVVGAKWDEIDFDKGVWTVPAERMKAGRQHRVPLSEPALAILRDALREDGNPFVFIGGNKGSGLSNMAMLVMLQRRMGRDDITVHGLRSSFRDWCAEQTHFPRELAEAALAHQLRDKVEAAYLRGDALAKRAQLMAAWAKYSTTPRVTGTVTAIRRASAA
jgi:integrase